MTLNSGGIKLNKTLLGSFYLALASSIWGGMYVVVKVVVAVVPPLELVWIRYLIAIVALVSIGLITRQKWSIDRKHIWILILIGVIGYAISIVTQETGTLLSTAQMGAMITSSTPAFMVIFARLILKEQLTKKQGISVISATIGVLLIIGVGNLDFNSKLGGISLLIAALTWALMSVLIKLLPDSYSQIAVTTYASVVAVIILTPFVLPRLNELNIAGLSHPTIWGGLLYLGIISTAGAFYLWSRGLQLLNASGGGLFFFFQPMVGAFLGWLLLGESIGITFWIGSALILAGVLLVITEKR